MYKLSLTARQDDKIGQYMAKSLLPNILIKILFTDG